MLTFIREIIKDMEDIDGDQASGCKTLPIIAGIKWSKIVVVICSLIVAVSIGWFQYLQWQSDTFDTLDYKSFVYIALFVQLPVILMIYQVAKANNKTDFHRASTTAKIIMVNGLLSIIVFWWLMK